METFYIIVLSIAAALLILTLTYVGITMNNKATMKSNFPPVQGSCPDYWTVTTDTSNNILCTPNGRNLPTSNGSNDYTASGNTPGYKNGSMNVSDLGWAARGSALCGQSYWANKYNVVWDGVSNTSACK